MRGFITFVSFTLFFLAAPVAVISYSLNLIINPEYMKTRLAESGIYEAVATRIPELIGLYDEEALLPPEVKTAYEEFLKKEITGIYIRGKTESLLGETFLYFSGKSGTPPQISLTELKDKALAATDDYPLPAELDDLLSSPLTPFSDEGSHGAREAFQFFRASPLIFGLLAAVSLVGILLAAGGIRSKLRRASLALFVTGIVGIGASLGLILLGSIVIAFAADNLAGSDWSTFAQPLRDLLGPLPPEATVPAIIIFAIFILVSILSFLVSFLVGKKDTKAPALVTVTSKEG